MSAPLWRGERLGVLLTPGFIDGLERILLMVKEKAVTLYRCV
jgi:hypothetical protein